MSSLLYAYSQGETFKSKMSSACLHKTEEVPDGEQSILFALIRSCVNKISQ